jgi:hypothetical protein
VTGVQTCALPIWGFVSSDLRISDIQRDKSPKADRTADYRKPDYTAFDVKKPDLPKSDMLKGDSYAPCATASTGYFSSSISLMGSEPVGGYLFTYKGEDASGNAIFDISCGGSYVAYGKAFPKNVKSQIDVPADSRKIFLTPHKTTASSVSITISVEMP